MGADGLSALGMTEGFFEAEDPNFTVQIGTSDPVTISIDPTDTITELVDKLDLGSMLCLVLLACL